MNNLNILIENFNEEINNIDSSSQVEEIRIKYLGKNGILTNLLKQLANLDPIEKKNQAASLNKIKDIVNNKLQSKKDIFTNQEVEKKLLSEKLDLTLPSRKLNIGTIHPLSQVTEELIEIFGSLGFMLVDGPEIEDDHHNFTALNVPENHPAREMQDSFYLDNKTGMNVLRTQTSSVQIRVMENGKPPFRIISIGKTYRSESDMTHTPMFHQIEGLVIDKKINMGHLKNCIMEFTRKFFNNENLSVRFRPSFFPFTEPSAEVDIGENDRTNLDNKWMEILGCGMVHPNVLLNVGIDPNEYQGFAFGMGIERLAMLKYNIKDLREFFEGDIRWLKHYGFSPYFVPNMVRGI